MRRALLLLVLATSAHADPKAEPAPAAVTKVETKPGPGDAQAKALLEKIVSGDRAARTAAIAELTKIAPTAIRGIDEWLSRAHTATVEERREVLTAIEASVPDAKGKFKGPERTTGKERKADDDVDWLPKLLELPAATPGLGEVIADVAAIRALSASKEMAAAQPIFDAAFRDDTMIYRDECGRYLRKMEPYSIPMLTKESAGRNDRKRYATWQLERIDRQEPGKALAAGAGDEQVTLAILEVFRTTKIREAVHAVWGKVNDDRPRVRAAARATWMDYITGPPPKPAPMKKLQLPGGKLTKKEKPLWLTYRELADNELRTAANELLHEDYPIEDPMSLDDHDRRVSNVKVDLLEVTKRLFDFYDGERAKQDGAQWAAAKAKADSGDLATAAAMLDRLIAQKPDVAERAGISTIYFAWGKFLEEKQQWADAAAAYSKAHGVDPKGAKANDALAAHHYTLGKSLEAAGKDGGADFRRAMALKPDYAPAKRAEETSGGSSPRPIWMLYAALIAGLLAAALFAVAMVRRRAPG
jgi:tetratricopeptide (TPR) repeat protein